MPFTCSAYVIQQLEISMAKILSESILLGITEHRGIFNFRMETGDPMTAGKSTDFRSVTYLSNLPASMTSVGFKKKSINAALDLNIWILGSPGCGCWWLELLPKPRV